MKKLTKYLLWGGAAYGAYTLYKRSHAATAAAALTAVPATPAPTPMIQTAQAPVNPSLGPGSNYSAAPAVDQYGTLSGTCFSSKRGVGIF